VRVQAQIIELPACPKWVAISDFSGRNRDVSFTPNERTSPDCPSMSGHAHLDRTLIAAQLTGGVYVPRTVLLVRSSATA
jgi:hypothetical protein